MTRCFVNSSCFLPQAEYKPVICSNKHMPGLKAPVKEKTARMPWITVA